MKTGRRKAEGRGQKEIARSAGSSLVSDPGPPRCIASGVRRLERAQARSSNSRLTLHPSFFALCLALFAPGTAAAQVVTDPTRPPAGYAAPETEFAGDSSVMVLQSVMISPTHKAAIINGVVVKLGEKYGDAVLIKVTENEVVLKSDGASQVLKLHPAVDKREIAPAAEKSGPRRGKARGGAAPAASGSAQPR